MALALLAATCRRGSAPKPASPSPSAPDAAVERLRSLSYVGFGEAADDRSGVVRRTPASWPGDNLYTTPNLCAAALFDAQGTVTNAWRQEPCGRWSHAELTRDGDLLVLGVVPGETDAEDPSARRFLMKLSWSGQRLWQRELAAHHDVTVTPTGELLTIVSRLRPAPEVHPTLPLRDNEVALLSAQGEPRASVSLYDAWRASPAAPALQPSTSARHGAVDLFHANAVDGTTAGEVLVTVRHQDVVLALDWAARRIAWAWGRGELSGPHDGRRLPDGRVLVFDNGLRARRSRVLEFAPADGRVAWSYQADPPASFFTVSRGSSQRLPNGNTLIAESDRGRAFEVTPRGELVWEFLNPLRNPKGERASIVRIRRLPPSVAAEIARRRGPGSAAALTAGSPASAASPAARR